MILQEHFGYTYIQSKFSIICAQWLLAFVTTHTRTNLSHNSLPPAALRCFRIRCVGWCRSVGQTCGSLCVLSLSTGRTRLDAYTVHRTEPLNRARDGSCVVDITTDSDKATTLRFLGWLKATHDIVPGLGVFCRAALSAWAEEYAKALADKGLKYTSIANYLNGLAMVCQFVYQTYEVDADALAMPTTPLDELLRLRGQCESQAKQQAL